MKKTILRCLVLSFVMSLVCQWAAAATQVVFATTYTDPDTSAISKYYQKPAGNALSKPQGEALANSIFAYTGSAFVMDIAESNEELLVYRNTNEQTGICYIELVTGNVFFNKSMENYLTIGETPDLPCDEEAPQIAHDHLTTLQLFPSANVVLQHVGGVGMAVHEEDGTDFNYNKLVYVYEYRQLDGLQVIGSSRLVTGLGSGGELVSLGKCWVNVLPVACTSSEILPGTAIRNRISAQLLDAYPDAEYIEVKNQQLVYFDDGNGVLEAALKTEGTLIPQGETESQPLDWIVSVMVTPHAVYPYNIAVPAPADPPADPETIPPGESE